MIRVGIVGCNFGRLVQLPAFRLDKRCAVVALAGTDATRTKELARQSEIETAFGNWIELVDDRGVDAVAIATPPVLQPAIAFQALSRNKPIFVEKPLAVDLETAAALVGQAASSGRPAVIDFEFPEIMAWQRAKALLDSGQIGNLRHIIITWNVENVATRLRHRSWKSSRNAGGGVLGNFLCHSLYYLEWFCGPLLRLSARMFSLQGRTADEETTAMLTFEFRSGAVGNLAMSCASYEGSGHKIELYGDDGTLILVNEGKDYMRGFRLMYARRPDRIVDIPVSDDLDASFVDGRIAPVARLVARFLDAIEIGGSARPDLSEGYRVQELMAAVRRSHDSSCWIDVGSGI